MQVKRASISTREIITEEEQAVMRAVQYEMEASIYGKEAYVRAYAKMGDAMRAMMRQVFPSIDFQ